MSCYKSVSFMYELPFVINIVVFYYAWNKCLLSIKFIIIKIFIIYVRISIEKNSDKIHSKLKSLLRK